ncbi:MAG: TldD/PmbA family protein [Candidatus Omnitrophica bacterium]|nr:TldD/PmbA family protein [Candidatus Omnitrophota bacterium]
MEQRLREKSLLNEAASALKRSKADYGDVRWVNETHEMLVVQNGAVGHIGTAVSVGCAVRALVGGAWGFSSSSRMTKEGLKSTAAQAVAMAKACAQVNGERVAFPASAPQRGSYRTPVQVDPFSVGIDRKLDYLFWANRELRDHPNIKTATTALEFFKTEKLFVSTEGSQIHQEIIESGASMEAIAEMDDEVQQRSYPAGNGACLAQAGYEYVKALDLVGQASRVRQEAVVLLRARECPSAITTVILMPDQMALQLHESCGHPVELDRVLGQELSFAGGSFLDPEKSGKFRYGSKRMNVTADAQCAQGVGTFGYDDEGVPAQTTPIVREGIFLGYLSSRESAARIRQNSSGAMRADGWNAMPLIRMTNVNLEPGEGSLKDLIADTRNGILMATNKSWSIDDLRLNFQFGTEIAWEIKKGRLGQPFKNPVYTGITPKFWGNLSGVAGPKEWTLYGVHNCGKGEPVQTMHTGHGSSPARFEKVQVGRLAYRQAGGRR